MSVHDTSLLSAIDDDHVAREGADELTELARLPDLLDEPPEIVELRSELARGRVPHWFRERIPYLMGAKESCDLIGTRHQEARRYRSSLTIALAILGISVIGNVVQATCTRNVPYVVQVDKTGYSVAIGPAERTDAADERVLIAYAANWVRSLRTVLADKDSQRALLKNVYVMLGVGTPGQRKAVEWLTKENPLTTSERRVDVEITRVAPLEAGKVFTVEWIERDRPGSAVSAESFYSALVTLTVSPVQRLDEVIANPLGIFVVDFAVSKIR